MMLQTFLEQIGSRTNFASDFITTHTKNGEVKDRQFIDLNFTFGGLENVHFIGCTFTKCVFFGTTLYNCKFTNCTFIECQMTNMEFSDVGINNCTFTTCTGVTTLYADVPYFCRYNSWYEIVNGYPLQILEDLNQI